MPGTPGPYRFGPFSFDPASGELRDGNAGRSTRLQPQVAALLVTLLERPGEVVTRAELRGRLWPDTTVDFDDGLNFCVRQLRLALGDDANAPTYVETLPKRGYRFVASVSRSAPEISEPVRSGRRRGPLVAALVVAAAVVALIVLARGIRRPAAANAADTPSSVRLAVVPFRADTTDPLVATYRRRLVDQINAGARSEATWQLVADTSAATHVLSGALKRRGFSVEVFVQLVDRSSHRHLWADSLLDSYPFSGNSTLTADRIERSVARLLGSDAGR